MPTDYLFATVNCKNEVLNMSNLNRREALLGMAGAGVLAAGNHAQAQPRQSDLIRRENQHEGTTDWQLTFTRVAIYERAAERP